MVEQIKSGLPHINRGCLHHASPLLVLDTPSSPHLSLRFAPTVVSKTILPRPLSLMSGFAGQDWGPMDWLITTDQDSSKFKPILVSSLSARCFTNIFCYILKQYSLLSGSASNAVFVECFFQTRTTSSLSRIRRLVRAGSTGLVLWRAAMSRVKPWVLPAQNPSQQLGGVVGGGGVHSLAPLLEASSACVQHWCDENSICLDPTACPLIIRASPLQV